MTASTARATSPLAPRPHRTPAAPPRTRAVRSRSRLELVPARQPGPPLVRLVIAVVALASMGLMGVLALHTFLAQDAYRLHDAAREAALLKAQEETLAHQVDSLNDPSVLAAKAKKLGMVPGGTPVFLRPDGHTLGASLPAGAKVGYPAAAPADGMVVVSKPSPSPQPTANPQPTTKPTGKTAGKPAGNHQGGAKTSSAKPTPAASGGTR